MLIQCGLPDIAGDELVDERVRPERSEYYVLDERRRAVPSTREQWQHFVREMAPIAETRLAGGRVDGTTFFTGVDYGFDDPDETGIFLFETLTRIGEDFSEDGAWRSWEEAEAAHRDTVERYEDWCSQRCGD